MIPENQKTWLNIELKQLPQFIRDNESYSKFVLFLEAYYKWLAETNNVEDRSKNLINYSDIDKTLNEFEEYFYDEFLQYFPEETLADKRELVKFSKQFYRKKSTESSFKFLFRALYNEDCELYNTRESVLVASSGTWVKNRLLRLETNNPKFLTLRNYKIIGELSKSIAKIERVQYVSGKTEVYLSDIIREFSSGEYVRIVDDLLNDVLFDGSILRAKIVGSIAEIIIDPNKRGLSYKVGDPVIISGGLNPEITNPVVAVAEIGQVSVGAISSATILEGSNGYRLSPNSEIIVSGGGGTGANLTINALDLSNPANVSFIPTDSISPYANTLISANSYGFPANPSANANTELKNCFGFVSIETYPIANLALNSVGYGYSSAPTITTKSYLNLSGNRIEIKDFGILAPLKIITGGFNYSNGDVISISGGSGLGAYANVKSVDSNGTITAVQFTQTSNSLPFGGILYNNSSLPSVSVISSNNKILQINLTSAANSGSNTLYISSTDNVKVGMYISGNGLPQVTTFGYFSSNTKITEVDSGNNIIKISNKISSEVSNGNTYIIDGSAVLSAYSVLGDGAKIGLTADSIGEIQRIDLLNKGQDYVSQPNVYLKIMDIAVTGINELDLPESGELIYQGDAYSPSFSAFVDSISLITEELERTFRLRIYSYNGTIDSSSLYIDRTGKNSKSLIFVIRSTYNLNDYISGVKIYGNGKAAANANFLNGTIFTKGRYTSEQGFLSSYNVLQSTLYNDYTYTLTLQKEFSKYKSVVYGLLHPAGSNLSARNAVKSNSSFDIAGGTAYHQIIELKDLTYPTVYGKLISENALQIYNLNKDLTSVYLSGVMTANTMIKMISNNGETFYSNVLEVDDENDIIYLEDYNILNFANVLYGYTESNSNNIIVTSATGKYDLINNGSYSNTNNKLIDIAYANDYVYIPNNSAANINNIDYNNWIIYANTTLTASGDANNPVLISITRNFVSANIYVDYFLDYRKIEDYYLSLEGYYISDEFGDLIYISTEV